VISREVADERREYEGSRRGEHEADDGRDEQGLTFDRQKRNSPARP
jgi:hypothetical protein